MEREREKKQRERERNKEMEREKKTKGERVKVKNSNPKGLCINFTHFGCVILFLCQFHTFSHTLFCDWAN